MAKAAVVARLSFSVAKTDFCLTDSQRQLLPTANYFKPILGI